eukprot:FR742457.1.p1 GENE.FR742457.1~~FR742457.1.p1  ORF type:complete len:267 (+),score=31.84 FR742457.1:97-897(+)
MSTWDERHGVGGESVGVKRRLSKEQTSQAAGHDANGQRAVLLFQKLDVNGREQIPLRDFALGHEEVWEVLDKLDVDKETVILRPDFVRAAAELRITSESLWRFENLVHSIYGGETEERIAVDSDGQENKVRSWSFLEESDDEEGADEESIRTGANPKDIDAIQTLIKTILKVQSKFEEYGVPNCHERGADLHKSSPGSKKITFPIDTDKNYFDKDGESRELVPYAGLDGEGVEWGEEFDRNDEPGGCVGLFFLFCMPKYWGVNTPR